MLRPPSHRRRAAGAVLLLAVVIGVAACGADADPPATATPSTQAEVVGVGPVRAGSVAQLAQCSDWNAGGREQRLATITDIRAQVNQAGADGPTPDLSDDAAYALFERACANDFAVGFRLYKLYLRAASFGAVTE